MGAFLIFEMTNLEKRVAAFETSFNHIDNTLKKFEKALSDLKNAQADLQKLEEYYYNGWAEDLEADRRGEISNGINRGILSEDAIYNLLGESRSIGVEMIKVAIKMVE